MRESRQYSLFEKQGDKWVRVSTLSMKRTQAVRFFQNALLNGFFAGIRRELRPVKTESVQG